MDSTDTNDHGMESILACTLIYYHVDFLLNFSGAIILSMLIDRTDVCLWLTHRLRYMAQYKCWVIIIICLRFY